LFLFSVELIGLAFELDHGICLCDLHYLSPTLKRIADRNGFMIDKGHRLFLACYYPV